MILGNIILIMALIAITCGIAYMLIRKPDPHHQPSRIDMRFGALFAGFYLLLGISLSLIGYIAGSNLAPNLLMLMGIPWTSLGVLMANDGLQASTAVWQPELVALSVVGIIINAAILYRLGQRIAVSLREPQL